MVNIDKTPSADTTAPEREVVEMRHVTCRQADRPTLHTHSNSLRRHMSEKW